MSIRHTVQPIKYNVLCLAERYCTVLASVTIQTRFTSCFNLLAGKMFFIHQHSKAAQRMFTFIKALIAYPGTAFVFVLKVTGVHV